MAATNEGISRNTTDVLLPLEVSREIWAKTIENSAIMQLAQRRDLPGAGQQFQTIVSDPTAAWVDETDIKPMSRPTLGTASWKGYTMATIIPFSNQFKRDKQSLYDEIIRRAPRVLGTKLDRTVFGLDPAPGELFDTLADATCVDAETDIWEGLVTADGLIAANDGILDGWVISPAYKSMLLTAKDEIGRPLFVNSMTESSKVPLLMGSPAHVKKNAYNDASPRLYGFAGDWSSAYYGVVQDIRMQVSDQATLTTEDGVLNLWERNMFAVRFEFEVGFLCKDKGHFVKLVSAADVAEDAPDAPDAPDPNL